MNKSELREEIFKLIYSLEVQKNETEEQIETFIEGSDLQEKYANQIKDFASQILNKSNELEDQINKNLKSEWKIDRVSKINIAILKVAIYEILYKKLPYKISINEAVELAKKYGEDTSASFVNGVLASVVKDNDLSEDKEGTAETESASEKINNISALEEDASEE